MGHHLAEITHYLWRQSWQLAVLIVALAVLSWILRNRSAHVRYLLWLIVVAKCLVPPFLTVPVAVLPPAQRVEPPAPLSVVQAHPVEVSDAVGGPSIAMPAAATQKHPAPPKRTSRFSMPSGREVLGAVWLAGVTVYGGFALTKVLRSSLRLRRQRKPLPDDLRARVGELLSDFKVKTPPKVWLLGGVGQPFVWGLLRGDIYLPADYLKIGNAAHRRNILGHEVCHILRLDAAVNSLQVLAQILFWFHPFVWWANQKIRMEREKCCDEMAIAHLGTKGKEYGAAIVRAILTEQESLRPVPSLAVAGPVKHIEERIRAMLKPGKRFHKRPSLIAATTVLLAAVLTVPTALVLTARAETDASKPQSEDTPMFKLMEAAEKGDIEQLKSLIAAGADVNAQDRVGITALFYAAGHNHLEAVRLLLAEGADVENPEMDWTPLHRAAWAGHLEVAKLLIAHKADVNAAAHNGSTPLQHAANNGHQLMVELLLSNGAKVDGTDHPYTPLFCAIDAGSEETVKTLIAHGADVNRKTGEDDYVPLVHAMWQPHTGIVKALIEAGADVNVTDRWGWTVMHHAILYGSPDMRQLLLDAGAEISEIHRAVLEGDLARVKSLIESGTDVNTRDTVGKSLVFWAVSLVQREIFDYLLRQGATIADGGPLRRAARKGLPEFVERLIDEGADVNARAGVRHPLGDAALYGREGVVKLLLAAGADVNLSTEYRGSALTSAARQGRLGLVELLIAHGADVNARYRFGTPLHAAVRAATGVDIIKKLLENDADVNATDKESGQTPLHLAAQIGRTEAAEVLLAAGADVNAKDNGGYTPLSLIAGRYGRREVADLLRRHGGEDVGPSTQADQPTAEPEQPSAEDADGLAWKLMEAAEKGDIEQLKSLIAAGADVNAQDLFNKTALQVAARHGHLEAVRLLLAEGTDVNLGGLHDAASRGHLEVAKLLIAHKADVNAAQPPGWTGRTPLLFAASGGHHQIVELLLSSGAKVDGGDHGYTPLFGAIEAGSEEIVKTLIAHGADVNRTAQDDYVPLVHAMWQGHAGIVKALIEGGADVNAKDRWDWTVMHHAIVYGSPEIRQLLVDAGTEISEVHRAMVEDDLDRVKSLIESGTDVNTRDTVGKSLVFWAVSLEQREIFDYLLRQGATIADGGPLRRAARKGLPEFVKRLIDEGADVNASAEGGQSPLWKAIRYAADDKAGRLRVKEVCRLLIAAGADVNLSTDDLGSALTVAAEQGRLALVDLLIAHGADVNMQYRGGTPLIRAVLPVNEIADNQTVAEIVKKLLDHGADVDARGHWGAPPLTIAAGRGRTEAVKLLLAAGADVNARCSIGRTPLSYVAGWYDRRAREVAELLRRHGGQDVAPSTEADQPTAQPEQRSTDDA